MKNTITILIFLLVIPLSVSGWRASANKSSKAYYVDNVLYMNPKSELIMWIDGKNGRVRIGDVFSPYSGCEEKSIMTCFIFSGFSISIPKKINPSIKKWVYGKNCYFVTGNFPEQNIYQILVVNQNGCENLDDAKGVKGSLLIYSKEGGLVYFEEPIGAAERSQWIKISQHGLMSAVQQ